MMMVILMMMMMMMMRNPTLHETVQMERPGSELDISEGFKERVAPTYLTRVYIESSGRAYAQKRLTSHGLLPVRGCSSRNSSKKTPLEKFWRIFGGFLKIHQKSSKLFPLEESWWIFEGFLTILQTSFKNPPLEKSCRISGGFLKILQNSFKIFPLEEFWRIYEGFLNIL